MTDGPNRETWRPEQQCEPDDAIRARVEHGLDAEWERVWEVPFYRARLAAAGFSPGGERPPLEDLPLTTKGDLRADVAANPPFGTWRAVPVEQATRIGRSGGTTGSAWYMTFGPRDLDSDVESRLQSWWRCGIRPGDRLTMSWPGYLYAFGATGGRAFFEMGVLELWVGPPASPADAEDHLGVWELLRPNAFMLTSSQINTYRDAADRLGVDLAELTKGAALMIAEASCQFEGPRSAYEDEFGWRPHTVYGVSDIPGLVTSDCRFRTGLHMPSTHYHYEVVDPATGREVPVGERGHLVVSTFGLDGLFLRFDTEDIVVQHEGDCPCGQTGFRGSFFGRQGDLATIAGRKVLPLDIQVALHGTGAGEFRTRPGAADALALQVEAAEGTDVASLADAVQAELGVPAQVELVPVGTFPQAQFKPRRVDA